FHSYVALPHLHSFPTRRSSDLNTVLCKPCACSRTQDLGTINESRGSALAVSRLDGVVLQSSLKHPLSVHVRDNGTVVPDVDREGDRKSTRLNSSHVAISYAVFC